MPYFPALLIQPTLPDCPTPPNACPAFSATRVAGQPGLVASDCSCLRGMTRGAVEQACVCAAGSYFPADSGVFRALADIASARPCLPCELATYKSSDANAACDACPQGMSTGRLGATAKDECVCAPTQYIAVSPTDPASPRCVDCPIGAICNGRAGAREMRVAPGYWRYSEDSFRFYEVRGAGAAAGLIELCQCSAQADAASQRWARRDAQRASPRGG